MIGVELRLGGLITLGERRIALGQSAALLDAIAETGSVSGAAERLGLSYRTAWGRIEDLQAAFGRPLVAKTKGHGSTLTPLGERLREGLAAVLREFRAPIEDAEASLTAFLQSLVEAPPRRLRLALSHDPLLLDALATLPDEVEAATAGSTEAVARLLAGEVDGAGFHFGEEGAPPSGSAFAALFARAAADPGLAVTTLFRREQGLILAAGNPLGLRSLDDVAARGARWVNRQRGSGTRLWLDRLLAAAGLRPRDIRGYDTEEFTHQAVAAVIASGAADAGMGVRAAAERFGLNFVPLGQETYFLALRTSPGDGRPGRLIEAVRARVGATPGYASPH